MHRTAAIVIVLAAGVFVGGALPAVIFLVNASDTQREGDDLVWAAVAAHQCCAPGGAVTYQPPSTTRAITGNYDKCGLRS